MCIRDSYRDAASSPGTQQQEKSGGGKTGKDTSGKSGKFNAGKGSKKGKVMRGGR